MNVSFCWLRRFKVRTQAKLDHISNARKDWIYQSLWNKLKRMCKHSVPLAQVHNDSWAVLICKIVTDRVAQNPFILLYKSKFQSKSNPQNLTKIQS